MGIAEWTAEYGSGWVFVFLAGCGVLVAAMLVVPWAAFRTWKDHAFQGVHRHGRRWLKRREAAEGRHRTPEGGRSTWEYIDSGAWKVISSGQAHVEAPLAGQDTSVISGRRLTPSDTEESDGHAIERRAGLGAPAGRGSA